MQQFPSNCLQYSSYPHYSYDPNYSARSLTSSRPKYPPKYPLSDNNNQPNFMPKYSRSARNYERDNDGNDRNGETNDEYQIMAGHQKPPYSNHLSSDSKFPSFSRFKSLLEQQETMLSQMHEKCEKDKIKVERDFENWGTSLRNLLQDFKLSVTMLIDQQYCTYVQEFKRAKQQFVQYCSLKKDYWNTQNSGYQNLQDRRFRGKQSINNQELLTSLNRDLKFCRKHLQYQNFSNVQQELLKPILIKGEQLFQHSQSQSFYNPEQSNKILREIYSHTQKQFYKYYDQISRMVNHYSYEDHKGPSIQFSRVKSLSNLSLKSSSQPKFRRVNGPTHKSRNKAMKSSHHSSNSVQFLQTAQFRTSQNSAQVEFHLQKTGQLANPIPPIYEQISKKDNDLIETYSSTLVSQQNEGKSSNRNWLPKDKTKQIKRQHSETALVILYLMDQDQIVVGTKNGSIKLFCVKTMNQVGKSMVLKASICSLANINRQYIGIGGDYGDSSVVLWDRFKNNKIAAQFSMHTAAVTAIIDLMDGTHFISTSFDMAINIYDHEHKKLVDSIKSNEKITMCVFSEKSDEIITGHLSKKLRIWQLSKSSGKALRITQSKEIILDDIPTAISMAHNRISVLIATKLNNICEIELYKTKTLWNKKTESVVCEIIPLFSYKQSNAIICDKKGTISYLSPDNENFEQIIGNGCNISHIYGINPKATITQDGVLFVCNHCVPLETEINSWRIFPEKSDLFHQT